MSISEFEVKRCEKALEGFLDIRRPPVAIRDKVDIGYRIENQSVELFEIRPQWNDPENKIESAIGKATYVKTTGVWKVYWQRQDLKWHSYEPMPTVEHLEDFLALVNEDAHACFFG